ncbi:MAG: hypothetical protein FWD59_06330 [Micrococcales bacterium]|nr:hypothetical protein [Micrococcales bacterium]
MLVLDSGGLSWLATRDRAAAALITELLERDLWPPLVPSMVLVESLTGSPTRDANTNRFLKTCLIEPNVTTTTARRAADLRTNARRGSAVDALVVALAEPGHTVLTADPQDLRALAASAHNVTIQEV